MFKLFELTPQFATAVWGGQRFVHLTGAPANEPIAEVWLASDLDHRPTRIANDPHQGMLLSEVIGRPFPFLIKLIDANRALSVQVHPDDEKARSRGYQFGKSEAWVVIDADPGSRIYAGLKPGVDRTTLEKAISGEQISELLHSFEPQPGDLIYLPAGTIHALGGGIRVFEIQQSCDITYRLYDWGRPREIHVAAALECASFSGPIHPQSRSSLVTPFFELYVHRSPITLGGDGRSRVLVSFGGASSGCIDLPRERAVFVHEMTGECRLIPSPGTWIFECVLP